MSIKALSSALSIWEAPDFNVDDGSVYALTTILLCPRKQDICCMHVKCL